jgi:predicted nucleotidyltransferase component of viral defense system
MQDLKKQEQFEMEVLDRLNSQKFLNKLVFAGGTMMRLCYGLDRYSADLDFWVVKDPDFVKLFQELKKYLAQHYILTDSANKKNTILLELKSASYPRSLKIEIRKEIKKIKTETNIAFSRNSNTQVMVKTVSLADMMKAKLDAFLDRMEIRDVFDIEFMFKRGVPLPSENDKLEKLLKGIMKLRKNDYNVKLGSILESGQRKYYRDKNFLILKMHLESILKF